jgi:hypothetical protein
MKKNLLIGFIVLLVLACFTGFCLWGCSSGGGSSGGGGSSSGGGGSTSFTATTTGGNYVTQSGKVSLLFPANALDQDTTFTVTPNSTIPSDSGTAPGTTYDFSPSKVFAQPVQLTVSYTPSTLGNIQEGSLKLYRRDGATWTQVSNSTVNTSSKTVNGSINSFSTYGIRGIPITPTPTPSGQGTFTGTVRDAVSSSPVAGATVTIFQDTTTVATGSTGTDGSYSVQAPAGSGYRVVFSKANYLTVDYCNISVSTGETVYLETVLLIDTAHGGNGNLDGTIKNALDGTGVSGLNMDLRGGINVQTGTIVTSTTTKAGGSYSIIDLPAGYYTGEISGSGYVTTYVTLMCIGGTTTTKDATISPSLPTGQTRIVLTWGSAPSDLDLHLTGPANDGVSRFHVYFGYENYQDYVKLDYDYQSGYGPETVTIYTQIDGVYRCSVHDYTNRYSSSSTALANSGAQVKVYRGSSLVATYNVPSQEGTLWTVFELNGNILTPVNAMSYESNSGNIKGRNACKTDACLMKNLPDKK